MVRKEESVEKRMERTDGEARGRGKRLDRIRSILSKYDGSMYTGQKGVAEGVAVERVGAAHGFEGLAFRWRVSARILENAEFEYKGDSEASPDMHINTIPTPWPLVFGAGTRPTGRAHTCTAKRS